MSFTKVKNNNLYDPDLVTLAEKGVGTGADQIVQRDGSGDIPGIGTSIQAFDATIMVDADIGTTVQAYDATIVVDADIGVNVQAYDATIMVDADIGNTVQPFDATILKDADIGVNVQAYDADTTKNDVANTFSADQTFANAILNPTPASDHLSSGIIAPMSCGETLVIGNLCYIKSDGKMWKTDADAVATMPGIAIALAGGAANASVSFLFYGFFRDDSYAWTVGADIYASGTAGALTATAPSGSGDIVQIVASATHADRIFFNPSLVTVEIA
jgi:hypothetical protein